jgi:CRP/FNR family transcriptional regulator, nitrogen oxide reductase regulator
MTAMSEPLPTPAPAAFAGMELFRGLPREALAEVLDRGTVRRLARNTVIFAQGQVATRCHALIDGRVRITQSDEDGTELLVRFIGPGQMFGTVALFTNGEYPAEAVAVIESVEISWPEAALLELIASYPQIALNMVRVIGARLREVQERLRELASQRVERRIAHALMRLAAQAGRPSGDGTTIDFPLTRKDLTDMCGATLHTVSRVMTAWEGRD